MGDFSSHKASTLFKGLEEFDAIAVAVSGGSDSLALLYLLSDWAHSSAKKLCVLTVDHQLRTGSKDEVAYVGALCKRLDIPHHALKWCDDKPQTGIPGAAREARYELMAAHCSTNNIQALVLGHTRNDQAETVLMRLKREAAHNRGLSAMAEKTLFSPTPGSHVMLCRPLLGVSREDLQSHLVQNNIEWVDDPTNMDEKYERVRVRAQLSDESNYSKQLIDYARLHGRSRQLTASRVAAFIDHHVRVSAFDCVSIERGALDAHPVAVSGLILQVLFSVVGGRDHLPPLAKVAEDLKRKEPSTLARVQLNRTKTHLILHREARNLPASCQLGADWILWDKRYWLLADDEMGGLLDVSSGQDCLAKSDEKSGLSGVDASALTSKFDKRALAAMPFGRIRGKKNQERDFILTSKSAAKDVKVSRALGTFDRYCTQFDFPIRQALERLFTV